MSCYPSHKKAAFIVRWSTYLLWCVSLSIHKSWPLWYVHRRCFQYNFILPFILKKKWYFLQSFQGWFLLILYFHQAFLTKTDLSTIQKVSRDLLKYLWLMPKQVWRFCKTLNYFLWLTYLFHVIFWNSLSSVSLLSIFLCFPYNL